MRITLLTNEYPPHVYGGAGVHVDHLSRELLALEEGKHVIQILCFGNQKEDSAYKTIRGIPPLSHVPLQDLRHEKFLDTLSRNIVMVGSSKETDIVHCHTWYTYLAGCLIKQLFHVPLVITTHSLEPDRPWKEEQLGTAYRASTWLEQTAFQNVDGVIAVSESMKRSVYDLYHVPMGKLRLIPNGIDANQYRPTPDPSLLASYRINPDKPYLIFVGRITRQKGILHLVHAIKYLSPEIQVVICAGAPDTEQIGREMEERVQEARAQTRNEIVWIRQWIPRAQLITLYTHASLFVCPSVYEPFGIVNLEAMACGTPVVASAVGGIPEIVAHGETGSLIPFDPKDPEQFSKDLAETINRLFLFPEKLKEMGRKSREKVEKVYSWKSIARQTLQLYKELTGKS
jgi:starch synthase